jgi:hypothetical protein
MSTEKDKKELTQEELSKALLDIFQDEESVKDLLEKGKKGQDYDDEQGDVPGEQDTGQDEYDEDEDMKKAKDEYDKAEKAMKAAKDKLEKMKKAGTSCKKGEEDDLNKDENKEQNVEKAESLNILKGFIDNLTSNDKEFKEEIRKSINDLSEKHDSLCKEWEKFASQPKGLKSYKGLNFIEKGEGFENNEEDNDQLSISKDKAKIEKAIESMIELTDNNNKKQSYENQLMNYNSSGDPRSLSKALVQDLQKSQDITLIK